MISSRNSSGRRKVLVARLIHEGHSFSRNKTTLADISQDELYFGQQITAKLTGTKSEVGAFIAAADDYDWELIPVVCASGGASGPITLAAYSAIRETILDAATANPDLAAILLSLHGSTYVDGIPDPEGDLLRRLRAICGRRACIAATLDLHANVTDEMVRYADILSSYRTTPHTDHFQTGTRVCKLLQQTLDGEIDPKLVVARRPMLYGMDLGRTLTESPMTRLHVRAREIEKAEPGVLDISLNAGYYMGDVFEAGPSVLVLVDGPESASLGRRVADDLIDDAYSWRELKTVNLVGVDEAIKACHEEAKKPGPLILADYTDGPGGGGYGDATRILEALIAADLPKTMVGLIYDPESVRQCIAAGVGATVALKIGGKTDQKFGGGPIDLNVQVLSLSDGAFTRRGPYMTGTPASIGHSALIQHGNVQVILASTRVQAEERGQYLVHGVEVEKLNILALKGINHFRADLEPLSRGIIFVDSGGIHAADLTTLPFKQVRRPIWPLDEDFE